MMKASHQSSRRDRMQTSRRWETTSIVIVSNGHDVGGFCTDVRSQRLGPSSAPVGAILGDGEAHKGRLIEGKSTPLDNLSSSQKLYSPN